MGVEIERKFLVTGDGWRRAAVGCERLRQGYLANTARCSVRVRLAGDAAFLSVKSMTPGTSRLEYEYPVPVEDAGTLLELLCEPPLVEKIRHRVPVSGHVWEVDEFLSANVGLVVAELELDDPDEPFARPDWLGGEVTHEARYYNFNLASRPYRDWSPAERGAA